MGIVGAYLFVGPRTMSEREQWAAVIAAGADESRIWIDKAPSRESRANMIERGLASGDVLVLAFAGAIGAGGNTRDRKKVVRALGDLGVRLQVRDGPAVLYDAPEKIDEFLATARLESLRAHGRLIGKAARGRPAKIPISDEQKVVICRLWWDKEIAVSKVYRVASELLGHKVERHHLQYWCSPLRQRPQDEAGDADITK